MVRTDLARTSELSNYPKRRAKDGTCARGDVGREKHEKCEGGEVSKRGNREVGESGSVKSNTCAKWEGISAKFAV